MILGISFLAGFGLLALLSSSKKTIAGGDVSPEEQKKAADDSKAAVQSRDWQRAVSTALASRDESVILALAKTLEEEGMHAESDALRHALALMKQQAADEADELREAEESQRAAMKLAQQAAKLEQERAAAEEQAQLAAKQAAALAAAQDEQAALEAQQEALAMAAAADALEAERMAVLEAARVEAEEAFAIKKGQAESVASMLYRASRYKENREEVKKYQAANGLTADGLYGMSTAVSLWENFKLVPPNPYYWPSSNTSAALQDYASFLLVLDGQGVDVSDLMRTLGR